ncbi:competence type IV pilus ATPase ComGA [Cytobacillus sp. S13-E01]|uniref:competence type IV pilus ATPase ComGA n=1 Tax=Cytobacillus sp. S13-E01 TaxID=3031326 RepID=UPI0023D80681|nr:competence type IV pilus ATPase ComGA [Cytobacillus sp. S13-E01]MDF0727792.1 competence type IV pilus ATPase ComGA [Cytobacillus sp. S13-E01]
MNPIEQLGDRFLQDAFASSASDIHFVPRKHDAIVQFRMDNDLITKEIIPREKCERLVSHFKFLAEMDIGERRRPQNGALSTVINNHLLSLRLSTLPTAYDESLVIRILPQDTLYPLSQLSLFPNTTKKLISLLKHSHGLIIFTGPTGSGKTTTLYSLLGATKKLYNRNIITLEDPIEKKSEDVLQVQVNEKAGITYAIGLKAILRHDPDIIMVGEIRDSETAQIAVRAALTGHLVLTTMHTRDAKGAIYRLLEFDVSLQEIEQTIIAVAAQRLVELKCPFCEGKCSSYCKKMRKIRRASVYELLNGRALSEVMKEAKGESSVYNYRKLRDVIKKGIALGYLQPEELDRWVFKDEQ